MRSLHIPFIVSMIVTILALCAMPAAAQDRAVPYWASIKAAKVHMRVGPGESYPIDWVYHRPDLPLKVIRMKEGWRLVQDPDGAEGWMVARFLSRKRTAIIRGGAPAQMRADAAADSEILWLVEPGVVGTLGKCVARWCRFDVTGRGGWVDETSLWGAGEP